MIATSPCGIRKRKENFKGFTSITIAVKVKIAAEAPIKKTECSKKKIPASEARTPPTKKY